MFGLSASRQSSQSSSLDYGVSSSISDAYSSGVAQSTGRTSQTIAFQDLFESLYGGAAGAAGAAAGQVPLFQNEAAQLFSGGVDFLGTLMGNPATDYLTSRLTGPDEAAQAQLGVLGQELGSFFNEQLLPGITQGGVATGTLGGSRQAVSTAMAAKSVGGEFSKGAASILANSQAQRDAAAGTLGAQTIQGAGTGLSALPQVLGLAQAGSMAALSPYLALAQILGGPTTLTESEQQATSTDIARSFAESFGFNYGTSQSSSKGKSFGISGGFAVKS